MRKVISEYETALTDPDPESALLSVLSAPPRYDNSSRPRRVLIGEVRALIDEYLEKNPRKRAMGLRKQCMRMVVREIIDEFFQVVKESILNNLSVQVRGFGTFFRKRKASKKARNLSKNIAITIPAHEVPAFKPSKDFQNCLKEQ